MEGTLSDHYGKMAEKHFECSLIVCIDTWLGTTKAWTDPDKFGNTLYRHAGYPSVYYQFLHNVIENNADDIIVPLPLPGTMGASYMQEKKATPDLVFIDGCHDYHCVLADVLAWYPVVKTGGTLFGDDVDMQPVKQGVHDAVEKLGVTFTIIGRYWCVQKL